MLAELELLVLDGFLELCLCFYNQLVDFLGFHVKLGAKNLAFSCDQLEELWLKRRFKLVFVRK